jgi:hypothetical protein
MQAQQTMQVRRAIRIPWLSLLIAGLLITGLALGVELTTRDDDAAAVRTVEQFGPVRQIGPGVRFGAGHGGFLALPRPHGPNQHVKGAGAEEFTGDEVTTEVREGGVYVDARTDFVGPGPGR